MSEKADLYRATLECIVNDNHHRVPCEIADDLLRFGWIKPAAAEGMYSARWIREMREYLGDDFDLTCYYVLTAAGHFILSPPANVEPVRLRLVCNLPKLMIAIVDEISHQERPNFDFRGQKGLHTRWGMYKREKRTERASKRVLTLVRMLSHVYRPYDFTPDGRRLWESAS